MKMELNTIILDYETIKWNCMTITYILHFNSYIGIITL